MISQGSGKPPFPELKYCTRCCMPETNEGMEFDELGICLACRSQEQKMRIDWIVKEKKLREILENAKADAEGGYDCIIPISGGKDSAFQLHILVNVYGMKPLAVTFSHNWWSEIGQQNLWNMLEAFDVDHIMYTPKRSTVNNLARQSLPLIGDACWHCHSGVYSFPFHVATKFKIPLMIYGESFAEASGRTTYVDEDDEDKEMVSYAWKNSAKVSCDAMLSSRVNRRDLEMFYPPTLEEMKEEGIYAVHLGDFLFWDGERQTEFLVNEYGWLEDDRESAYKHYKSVECKMAGVHDYAKFVKRGFGRGTDEAAQDVRSGLMTREEAFELIKEVDFDQPESLKWYLEITGYSEKEFYEILNSKREGKAKILPDFYPNTTKAEKS